MNPHRVNGRYAQQYTFKGQALEELGRYNSRGLVRIRQQKPKPEANPQGKTAGGNTGGNGKQGGSGNGGANKGGYRGPNSGGAMQYVKTNGNTQNYYSRKKY